MGYFYSFLIKGREKMKKCKIIALFLVCIIMSTSMLTSCDVIIDEILSYLGNDVDEDYLSGLGIGYSYNLIENKAYDVTKTSTSGVLDVSKLLEFGTYDDAIDINKTRFQSYHYSSVDELITKQMMDVGFEVGFDFVVGEMKVAISGDCEYDRSQYTYNETFVIQDEKISNQHIIRDIYDPKTLKQCLTEDFINDIESVKNRAMLVEEIYDKYGTHAIVGVVTGGAYTAQYVVSTNDEKIASKSKQNYEVSGKADIGKYVEFGLSLDIAFSEEGQYSSTDTKTNFSIEYSGSNGGTTTTLKNLETAIKEFEAGVEENAIPINFPDGGAIPIADLIRAAGYEYNYIADDFQTYVDIEAYKAYIGLYNLPLEYERINEKNCLIMDFSSYQKNGSLKDLHDSSFIDGIITISPMMAYNADTIIIKGGIGYSGQSNIIDSLSIRLDKKWDKDIDIVVENVGAKTADGRDFIDTSNVNNKYRVNIEYSKKDIIYQNSTLSYYNDSLPNPITIVLEDKTKVKTFDMTKQDFPTFVHQYGDEFFKYEGLFTASGEKISDENGKAVVDISLREMDILYPKFSKTRIEEYIVTAEDFKNISNNMSGNYVIIVDELDLTPLRGYMLGDFYGTLDGDGCVIKNWSYMQSSVGNIGIFKSNLGHIHDLTLTKCKIDNTDPDVTGILNAGIICGENKGTIQNVMIVDCDIEVDVGNMGSAAAKNYAHVGGICGQNSGNVLNCTVTYSVLYGYAGTQYEGAEVYIGGVVGYSVGGSVKNVAANNNNITCTVKANVDKNIFGCWNHGRPRAFAAGLIGYCTNTETNEITSNVSNNTIDCMLQRDCNCSGNKEKAENILINHR